MIRNLIELWQLRNLMDRWRRDLDEGRRLGKRLSRLSAASAEERAAELTRSAAAGRWRGMALGTTIGLLAGAAAGLAAVYLADPSSGRRRRAMLVDRAAAGARDCAESARRFGRYATGRASGVIAAATRSGDGNPNLNDASLREKVETELFRDPAVPKGQMNVNVEDGIVVIRGEIGDSDLADALTDRAARIPGIRGVENLLHPPGQEPVSAIPHNELEA